MYNNDSTYLYDWDGKIYCSFKGAIHFISFNQDSTKFFIYNQSDSVHLINWDGKIFSTFKGKIWLFLG